MRGTSYLGLQEDVSTLQFHHSPLQSIDFLGPLVNLAMTFLIRIRKITQGFVEVLEVFETVSHLLLTMPLERGQL